ncbi:hypothetical protein IT418_01315 [bacterium]|nr:hypothetical protein [bacterium]
MIVTWLFIIAGLALFYGGWHLSMITWARLEELGIDHTRSSTTYFDRIFSSSVIALIFSRLIWMLLNVQRYAEVPWGLLAYNRSVSGIEWFSVFPWRFFKITEGVYFPLFWVIVAIGIVFGIFIPTIRLARRLKLEKRGIMRSFILRSIAGIIGVFVYFGFLVYYSLI